MRIILAWVATECVVIDANLRRALQIAEKGCNEKRKRNVDENEKRACATCASGRVKRGEGRGVGQEEKRGNAQRRDKYMAFRKREGMRVAQISPQRTEKKSPQPEFGSNKEKTEIEKEGRRKERNEPSIPDVTA
ncbi:hypothetical protein GALMADRAFT_206451 [Galerina marginata CBS 339.88]|uniref:Uncharacterized protein n=1 Tax=Galerina marginata (strain CBS 339.88) TaxID=685588 RepID=A0A067THK7_GALM3|nr:hypothetical protein GALMADRAFT_206451 [Galerina marginata CBS 339.88]